MTQRLKNWVTAIKEARVIISFAAIVGMVLVSLSHAYWPVIAEAYDIASEQRESHRDSTLRVIVNANATRLDSVQVRQNRVLKSVDQIKLMMLLSTPQLSVNDKERIKSAIIFGRAIDFDSVFQSILLNER